MEPAVESPCVGHRARIPACEAPVTLLILMKNDYRLSYPFLLGVKSRIPGDGIDLTGQRVYQAHHNAIFSVAVKVQSPVNPRDWIQRKTRAYGGSSAELQRHPG